MAKVITLSRHRTRNMIGNRKDTGAVKETRKPGMFFIAECKNWLTGFKTDEVSHSSEHQVDIQRIRPTTARRYF